MDMAVNWRKRSKYIVCVYQILKKKIKVLYKQDLFSHQTSRVSLVLNLVSLDLYNIYSLCLLSCGDDKAHMKLPF